MTILHLLISGALWGVTNPFLKKANAGTRATEGESDGSDDRFTLFQLLCNWKYLAPFAVNQCGSVLYFLALQESQLSVAVPVANSVAFLTTALTGWSLGEEPPRTGTVCGMLLIVAGITLCCSTAGVSVSS